MTVADGIRLGLSTEQLFMNINQVVGLSYGLADVMAIIL